MTRRATGDFVYSDCRLNKRTPTTEYTLVNCNDCGLGNDGLLKVNHFGLKTSIDLTLVKFQSIYHVPPTLATYSCEIEATLTYTWSPFEKWEPCSVSCGGGTRSRFRDCLVNEENDIDDYYNSGSDVVDPYYCDGDFYGQGASESETCNSNECTDGCFFYEWDKIYVKGWHEKFFLTSYSRSLNRNSKFLI